MTAIRDAATMLVEAGFVPHTVQVPLVLGVGQAICPFCLRTNLASADHAWDRFCSHVLHAIPLEDKGYCDWGFIR